MMRKAGLAVAALGLSAVSLQGCGGGGGGGSSDTTTTTKSGPPATTTTIAPLGPLGPQDPQDFVPVRGISYQARPFKVLSQIPGTDQAQEGFEPQFHTVRDDLGMMRKMGASAVRIYAGLGSEIYSSHGKFLDRCKELGMNVIVDFYTPGLCENFDCSSAWKKTALNALTKQGYMKDGNWHPAVKMVMLMQEPDNLPFTDATGAQPVCPTDSPGGKALPWCRVKAVLSAFDGLLQAEKDAGVSGQGVYVGVAWSFTQRVSIDGLETAELYGFQDMKAAIAKPDMAKYAFTTADYSKAWSDRWVHAINSPAVWKFTKEKVLDRYAQWNDQKLLISQLTPDDNAAQEGELTADLKAIDDEAKKGGSFMGVVYNGFQSDYENIDAFTRLFSLGDVNLGNMNICMEDPRTPETKTCSDFPLYCLDMAKGKHAADVVAAWGGSASPAVGLCKGQSAEAEMTQEEEFVF